MHPEFSQITIQADNSADPDILRDRTHQSVVSKEPRRRLEQMLANELDFAFRRRALAVFDHLDLEEGQMVLDCGCGRGYYLNFCRGLTSRTTLLGIDSDMNVLTHARYPEGRENIFTFLTSATGLPFQDESFDRVIFSEVLEHIEDHDLALREVWRVLVPGGVAVLTVPNARFPFLYDPVNSLLGFFGAPIRNGFFAGIWTDHVRLYSLDELVSVTTRTGFEVEERELLSHVCIPFQHNLLYGVGKGLLLSGHLPTAFNQAGDRSRYGENSGSLLNPINLGRRIMGVVDSINDRIRPRRRSVNLLLKIRKPAAGDRC